MTNTFTKASKEKMLDMIDFSKFCYDVNCDDCPLDNRYGPCERRKLQDKIEEAKACPCCGK